MSRSGGGDDVCGRWMIFVVLNFHFSTITVKNSRRKNSFSLSKCRYFVAFPIYFEINSSKTEFMALNIELAKLENWKIGIH